MGIHHFPNIFTPQIRPLFNWKISQIAVSHTTNSRNPLVLLYYFVTQTCSRNINVFLLFTGIKIRYALPFHRRMMIYPNYFSLSSINELLLYDRHISYKDLIWVIFFYFPQKSSIKIRHALDHHSMTFFDQTIQQEK